MAGASPKNRPVITYGQRESHGRWEGAEEEEGEPLGVVGAHGELREASARDVDTSSHQRPVTCLPRAVANARVSLRWFPEAACFLRPAVLVSEFIPTVRGAELGPQYTLPPRRESKSSWNNVFPKLSLRGLHNLMSTSVFQTSAPRVRSAAPNASALMTAPAGQARQRTLPVTPQSHANARKESPVDVLRPLACASRPEDELSMASSN
ncbi:Protein of unknown function [Gryllus bimaculatus]|nr:Protein of unknown function [Gryllus bimaculatus]